MSENNLESMPRYILLDARAHIDIERAAVLDTADNKSEARKSNFDYGDDSIWMDSKTGQLKYNWYSEFNNHQNTRNARSSWRRGD